VAARLSYRNWPSSSPTYVIEMGFPTWRSASPSTPYGGSLGHQVTSYYAPTSAVRPPGRLRYLVDALPRAGIVVILDWVPGHFPRD